MSKPSKLMEFVEEIDDSTTAIGFLQSDQVRWLQEEEKGKTNIGYYNGGQICTITVIGNIRDIAEKINSKR